MRTVDKVFLACVLVCVVLLAAQAFRGADLGALFQPDLQQPRAGVAGQARDVNLRQMQHLIDAGALSDHEAEFYKPVNPQEEP